MEYEHYKDYVEPRDSRAKLDKAITSGRAMEAAEMAERERKITFPTQSEHGRLSGWLRRQDHLTEADQAEIIKASVSW